MKLNKRLILKNWRAYLLVLFLLLVLGTRGVIYAKDFKNAKQIISKNEETAAIATAAAPDTAKELELPVEIPVETPKAEVVSPPATKKTTTSSTPAPTRRQATPLKNNVAPSTPTPVTAPVPKDVNFSVSQIIALINNERARNGLQPVIENGLLNQAAYLKTKDMSDNNYFAHTAPDGTADVYFVEKVGYKYQSIGFNIAKGDFGNSAGLVQAWMDSTGHRANILANYGQQIGIGIYGKYYVMMIAKVL